MAQACMGEDFSEELTCGLCLDSWKEPIELTPCGHIFCKECFTSLHTTECPMRCGAVASQRKPNRTLVNMSLAVQVRCPTCDWTGTRETSMNHVCRSKVNNTSSSRKTTTAASTSGIINNSTANSGDLQFHPMASLGGGDSAWPVAPAQEVSNAFSAYNSPPDIGGYGGFGFPASPPASSSPAPPQPQPQASNRPSASVSGSGGGSGYAGNTNGNGNRINNGNGYYLPQQWSSPAAPAAAASSGPLPPSTTQSHRLQQPQQQQQQQQFQPQPQPPPQQHHYQAPQQVTYAPPPPSAVLQQVGGFAPVSWQPNPVAAVPPPQQQQQQFARPNTGGYYAPAYVPPQPPQAYQPQQQPQPQPPPMGGSAGGGFQPSYSPHPGTSAARQYKTIEPSGPRPWTNYGLSQDEYDQIVSLFIYFDEDESGFLDRTEVSRLALSLNFASSPEKVDEIFQSMAVTGNGILSMGELLTWLKYNRPNSQALYGLTQQQYNTIMMQFHTYDGNRDGSLGRDEFCNMVLNLREVSDRTAAQRLFDHIDRTGTGGINLTQFLRFRAGLPG